MSLGVLFLLLLASAQTPPASSPTPPPVQGASTNHAALGGPPAPPREQPGEADTSGTWKGTTSQGREIEIEVAAGNLKLLRLGWQIAFERECVAPEGRLPQRGREGLHVMRYQYTEPVAGGRLKTRIGIGSDLDLVVSGSFGPDGTGSGDLELSTVGATRCTGKVKATWKATRK